MDHFVRTEYEHIAEELRANGFKELPKDGRFFVFINKPSKVEFSDSDKIMFTNKLNI